MKYDHMVKSNGIVYLPGEEVPEPVYQTEETELTDDVEETKPELEKPKRTRRTK